MILLTAEEILKDIGAEPLIVSPETTVHEAVQLMLEKGNHAVLIAEDGNYLGILSFMKIGNERREIVRLKIAKEDRFVYLLFFAVVPI
jgi:predicted transcriptional regulator